MPALPFGGSHMTTDTYGRTVITIPRDTVLAIVDDAIDAVSCDDTSKAFALLELLKSTIKSEV